MRNYPKSKRILTLLLVIGMVLTMAPFAPVTANATTVKGDAVTVNLNNTVTSRENNFNKDWKFYLGTSSTAQNVNFDDSSWKDVDLPHDFSITQNFTTSGEAESGFLPGGTGWYRKRFTLDAADKTVLLRFDGVYMDAYVYVNGTFVGEHHYGYTSFAFDITDYLTRDGVTENVVAVKAVNSIPSSRWYSGSGIYRDVTLYVMDGVHVDLNGTQVTTPNISSGNGTVNVQTDVVNDTNAAATVTVTNTVYHKGSTEALASASSDVTVPAGSTATATSSPVVSNPALWSIDSPNLYTVVTTLTVNGNVVDSYETEFGFRWFTFSSSGFALNCVNVKLNGVCLHHDQGALGSAAYYDAMYRQLSIMKDMGVNAVRTAHNPADEDFIAICNELGLLVIEESFDSLDEAKNSNSNDFARYFTASVDTGLYGATSGMTCAEFAARSMVKRDRNAPCIFAWSFGNEIQEGTHWATVGNFATYCASFINWVNDEDGTRIVTSGDNNRGGDSRLVAVLNKIIDANGVVGFNYANDLSTVSSLLSSYGGNHNCIILSETSSHTNSRGIYSTQSNNANGDGKYHITSFDTSSVTWGITAHESIYNTYQYDGVAGEFIWTGFDYIGEPTPWNGTTSGSQIGYYAYPNSSYFGAVDTAGFPKDTFYLYRAQWNKSATTVHLVTAWDSDNYMTSSGKVPVWLYSNAAKVELYLNGTKIGTATRTAHTSTAGHTYYTYSATSDNSSVCTVSNGSGSSALYAVFNVAYTAGTLSTKAYDENGNEIILDDSCGRYTVSTPGTPSKLVVSQNKTTASADGSSLVYISVDVTDANGNLDTTATNKITFSLTGNGEIVGVDNGDQATTAKYQQSSVLTGATSANINAYAGKALVIVRTTEDAGSFTVNVSASGLTGGNASVTTTAVTDTVSNGLVSYTMIRDYTVKAGTLPELETTATGTHANGSTVTGTIVWESIPQTVYQTAGDYTINGVLTLDSQSIDVTCRLHVIANVIAMRNVSTATTAGVVPTLPSVVTGVLADGTLSGEFNVVWDSVSSDALATVGNIVTVNGTATVLGGETLPVTCTIRVAQAVQSESSNIAPQCYTLEQDIVSNKQSDNLDSIKNGTLKPGDNTSERWTNWGNRTTSADATLTMTWATAHNIGSVNIYYYYDNCCAYPEAIQFLYSLNGSDYTQIDATAELIDTYNLGAMYTYTFAEPVNPVGLKVKLTQQDGTTGNHCVGITELEVMTYAAQLTQNTSADLSGITVDGTSVNDFAADTLSYTASGASVAATTGENAGITVLPVYDGVVRILTISEDGSATRTYAVTVTAACAHENTETRNAKAATCTEDGYTGDTYCNDCQTTIVTGSPIPATGHQHTRKQNVKAATCTEAGYSGDTYCEDCQKVIAYGETIASTGHSWDSGKVTEEATESKDGTMTYTCTVCGETRTETIPYVKELKAPTVSLNVTASNGKLVMTGCVDDYENLDDYYTITAHGIIYMQTKKLGARVLTTNSPGRTRVNFSGYKTDGSYIYRLTPTNQSVSYTIRAFIAYTNEAGKTVYVYSSPVVTTYNKLG